MVQENGMMLEVLPLEAGGARLVRVYGQDPCVVLPGSVPAPAGGSWPITELGDYCFSEKPRSLPASDAVCRYQVDDTGAVRLTRAFGQAVGGSARRYDFDFDAPAADPDDLHPVCGSCGRGDPAGPPAGHWQLCLLQLPEAAPAYGGSRGPDAGQ